jgi:hypothetical protein
VNRSIITWDADVIRLNTVAKSRHPLLRETGYFAVLAARLDASADLWHDLELLYIGASFERNMRRGIAAACEDDGVIVSAGAASRVAAEGRELVVMLGEQTETTLKRVPRGFNIDVAHCLVYRHRPTLNPPPAGPYAGRKISVINRGDYAPLMPKCLLRPQV